MRLAREEVTAWIADRMGGAAPPVVPVDRDSAGPLRALPGMVTFPGRALDPGCFPFFLDPVAFEFAALEPAFRLGAAAERIAAVVTDERRQVPVLTGGAAGGSDAAAPAEPRTEPPARLRLPGGEVVDVVGPGGRIRIAAQETGIFGHAAVRPLRWNAVAPIGRWQSSASVTAALEPYFGQELDVFPEYGYFEASWLEEQQALRPVFVFAIESDPERGGSYRTELIVPATFDQ